MMYDINKALYQFWSGFGIPAYLEGNVPVKETRGGQLLPIDPPYITFDVRASETFGTEYLTAIDWHKKTNGDSGMRERAELMDRIAKAIPQEGTRLDLDGGGYLAIYRGPDFQTYYDDPADHDAIGGRTSYLCIYYTL